MKNYIKGIVEGLKMGWVVHSIAWKSFGPFGYKLFMKKNREANHEKYVKLLIERWK